MQNDGSAARNGVVVAHGYGIKIYVERGRLVVHDGVGRQRQTRRFARATSGVKRGFVVGHTGYITFEAARWMREIGAAYAQIDSTGSVVLVSGTVATDHAPLRRAQALATYTDAGIAVARSLLADKDGHPSGTATGTPRDGRCARDDRSGLS